MYDILLVVEVCAEITIVKRIIFFSFHQQIHSHYNLFSKIVHPAVPRIDTSQTSRKKLNELNEGRRNGSSQQKNMKERKSSRLIRYSIARRIKSHCEDRNENFPVDDSFAERNGYVNSPNGIDPLKLPNQLTRPFFIILPR